MNCKLLIFLAKQLSYSLSFTIGKSHFVNNPMHRRFIDSVPSCSRVKVVCNMQLEIEGSRRAKMKEDGKESKIGNKITHTQSMEFIKSLE